MNNIDFISEKWRTVRRTRRLSYIHLASFLVPILYVATYAEAQRRADDSKELGAALAALMFNLIQLMRTLMGIVQLKAFAQWCRHGVECMRALLGADAEGAQRSNDSEDVDDVDDVDEKVRVNNTVVDNELGGRDVTVLPSLRKIWRAIKRGDFRPSSWLKVDQPELCTIRWCGALLCGMGEQWSIAKLTSAEAPELLASFFSWDLLHARANLQRVTWEISKENGDSELMSIQESSEWGRTDLSGEESTAFGTPLLGYSVRDTSTVDAYSFEFDSLVSSYPASGGNVDTGNRKKVAVGLVHSVLLAKHIGVEKLRAIRQYYDRYHLPTRHMLQKAFELFLTQSGRYLPEDSKLWQMFRSEYWQVPVFPYRMQMVALWDEATNWRVLQASAHHDIFFSLIGHKVPIPMHDGPIFEMESDPSSVFEYCASRVLDDKEKGYKYPGLLGVVLESVRTFLAEWVATTPREPNWKPKLPSKPFAFFVSENCLRSFRNDHSLIWACQHALQRELARPSNMHQHENLPANCALIILFLLGFPILKTYVSPRDSTTSIQRTNTSSTSMHLMIDANIAVWHVRAFPAPQDVYVEIRVNFETREVSLSVQSNRGEEHFIWQDWVNAAMGAMKGWNERDGVEIKYERTIMKADLQEPMVELSPLNIGKDGNVEKTRTARVWLGWPAFDLKICKFEVEQWLLGCGIELSSMQGNLNEWKANREVDHAEQFVESVLSAKSKEIHACKFILQHASRSSSTASDFKV